MNATATATPSDSPTGGGPSPFDFLERALGTAKASLGLVRNFAGHVEGLVTDVLRDTRTVADESVALYSAAQVAALDVRAAVRGTPRFTTLVSTSVGVMARYRWFKVSSAGMSAERAAAKLEILHQESSAKVVAMCIELGGGALKLGQFLSTRMDLLPEPWVVALSQLQDRVPGEPWETISEALAEELDQPHGEVFVAFNEIPMAAASLAQVHAATLEGGRQVAVKVQRPGIAETLEIDIAAMGVIARVLRELVPQMDMASITAEVAASLRHELDFVEEADNIADFREVMGARDYPILPQVLRELSTPKVLTLDLIDGERLIDYLEGCEADIAAGVEGGAERRDELCRQMVDCYCEQILVHHLMHADPHPGNFLVVTDKDDAGRAVGTPRLALLDFGSVTRFEPQHIRAYAQLVGATLAGKPEDVAKLLLELGFEAKSEDTDTLVEFSQIILEQFRQNMNIKDIDPHEQLKLAIELAQDNPIVSVPRHFVMLGRVLGSLGGVLMRYKPDLNLFKVIGPHLAVALRS